MLFPMRVFALAQILCMAWAGEVVRLNAFKVRGDGKTDLYQSSYGPHVLIDTEVNEKPVGFLKRGYVPVEIKYTQLTYFVEFEIGSNKDKVLISLDSGSSDFWVNGSHNEKCLDDSDNSSNITNIVEPVSSSSQQKIHWASDGTCYVIVSDESQALTKRAESSAISYEGCLGFGVFDADDSTTFKESDLTFEIQYGDNSSSVGILGSDTVYVGGVEISNVTFGVNEDSTANGMLGLGFPVNQAGYQLQDQPIYDNLPTTMKKQGLIDKVVYSLKASIASQEYQSELLFGGYDRNSYTGQLTLLPIIDYIIPGSSKKGQGPYYLSLTLNSLTFDNESTPFATGAAAAILDSGATGSFFPSNVILAIAQKYGFELSQELGGYAVSESKIKDAKLKFNLQGASIEVPLVYFTYPVLDSTTYAYSELRLLSVVYYKDIDYFILGDDFLSMVSFVVDMEEKQVAIGQANLAQHSENIVVVSDSIPDAVMATDWDKVYGSNGQTTLETVGKAVTEDDIGVLPANQTENLTGGFIAGLGIDLDWV